MYKFSEKVKTIHTARNMQCQVTLRLVFIRAFHSTALPLESLRRKNERNMTMKNNRTKKSPLGGKGLVIASVVGVAAAAAAVISAYNATMSRLVPTNANTNPVSSNTWIFEPDESDEKNPDEKPNSTKPAAPVNVDATEEPAAPVGGSITGVPIDEDEPAIAPLSSEETGEAPAAEVNKPITADIGNIMPVDGEVANPFSNGELVKSTTLGVWKTHDGCDILCTLGTDVRAMSEGMVKEITDDPLWGVYVVVEQSNGLEVHYCGLTKELNVKAGQQINQGEIIGKTGDTCQIEILEEPHLHLGVKQNGEWIDPMSVIS